jgi:hypothetical protein
MPSKQGKMLLIIGVVVGIATVGGVLFWNFRSEDDDSPAKTQVPQSIFNNTGTANENGGDAGVSGGDGGGGGDTGDTSNDPVLTYEFIQCDIDTDTADAATTATCCNGMMGLCDLRVNEILYGYLHNAVATKEDDFQILVNHDYNLESALTAGFRAMELDVGRCDDKVVFFHAQCLLGSRSIAETLSNINSFLNENPNEILILKLEMTDDSVTLQEVADIMDTVVSSGSDSDGNINPSFRDRLYQKEDSESPWPTLGELVAQDQRILLFYYAQPDCANQQGGSCPAGFHFWFDYGVNTQYSFDSIEDIDNVDASCVLTGAGANSQRDFFRVNAFVSAPSRTVADTVNTRGFGFVRMQDCAALNENLPVNFYSVDFWTRGDVPRMVQEYNRNLMDTRNNGAA